MGHKVPRSRIGTVTHRDGPGWARDGTRPDDSDAVQVVDAVRGGRGGGKAGRLGVRGGGGGAGPGRKMPFKLALMRLIMQVGPHRFHQPTLQSLFAGTVRHKVATYPLVYQYTH